MKKFIALVLVLAMSLSLAACSGASSSQPQQSQQPPADGGAAAPDSGEELRPLSLTVSGIDGSVNFTPIYIGLEKGMFEAVNLDVDYVLFTSGPVQMESLASNSWDLGFTGVGGVLSGLISYDATLVGATNTDNGTQTVWVNPDSAIAQAGTGHNSISDQIVGDAESWKGATVLCNSGTVLEYLLICTLGGFGLSIEDVEVITMDPPTANASFIAGTGDAAVITGAISFAEDKANYVEASCGNWAQTGLECSVVANTKSYQDPDTYEAMVRFMTVYWQIIEWMNENPDEAAQLCSDFNAECGTTLEVETASLYLAQDPYYTAGEVLTSMTTVENGHSVMEENLLGVLEFFISVDKYAEGDQDKMLGHMDTRLMEDVCAALG